jgi:hypothetical protein
MPPNAMPTDDLTTVGDPSWTTTGRIADMPHSRPLDVGAGGLEQEWDGLQRR